MALKFSRKGFKTGVCLVEFLVPGEEEVEVAGKMEKKVVDVPTVLMLKPSDLGKDFEFPDEAAVLAKYPVLFKKV